MIPFVSVTGVNSGTRAVGSMAPKKGNAFGVFAEIFDASLGLYLFS